MKILYYNWVQFDDADRRGGGVTVYQNNLIKEMVRLGHQVYFFSSGLNYSLIKSGSFIRETRSQIPECRTFEIVNSSVMAPSHAFWGGDEVVLNDQSLNPCMRDFAVRHGPFDVVHFQNLEGIPLPLLSQEVFGNARLFYSAHNYYAVCPQVNLWRYETANCLDYNGGQSCTYCLPGWISLKRNLLHAQFESALTRFGLKRRTKAFTASLKALMRLRGGLHTFNRLRYALYLKRSVNPIWRLVYGKSNQPKLPFLAVRRARISEALARNDVTTIAVSQRTHDVITKFGHETGVVTAYIGTEHSGRFSSATKLTSPRRPDRFTLAYLGYMRVDKGFYFFLDAMERLPRSLAQNIDIVVAAKNDWNGSLERLMRLNAKFRSVSYYDGFTSKDLDHILRETDLGIIPSLWEDNLPQVAIEIVSRGIPILTSDLGGAREISANSSFVFKSGDHKDFLRVLKPLATQVLPLGAFWENVPKLFSMAQHSSALLKLYEASTPKDAHVSAPNSEEEAQSGKVLAELTALRSTNNAPKTPF